MLQLSGRMKAVLAVCAFCVIVAAGTLRIAPTQAESSAVTAQTEEASTVTSPVHTSRQDSIEGAQTILTGMRHWRQHFDTVQGFATIRAYRTATYHKDALAALGRDEPAHGYGRHRELMVVRFFVGDTIWRADMVQLADEAVADTADGNLPLSIGQMSMNEPTPIRKLWYVESDGVESISYGGAEPGRAVIERFVPYHKATPPLNRVCEYMLMDVPGYGPLVDFLTEERGILGDKNVRQHFGYDLEDTVEGFVCHRASIYYEYGGLNVVTFWVAPELGYMPVRQEFLNVSSTNRRQGVRHTLQVLSAIEAAPGMWLPQDVLKQEYVYRDGRESNRESNCIAIRVVRFSDVRVNLDKTDLAWELPIGTVVMDRSGERPTEMQIGDTARALAEFMKTDFPEASPSFDVPLSGREFDEVFPPE